MGQWKIVYEGKVAIAMDREMQSRWERGGFKVEAAADGRSIKIDLPREGSNPGMKIICAYGPTGNERKNENAREVFLTQLASLKGYNSEKNMTVGGDWNAKLGAI